MQTILFYCKVEIHIRINTFTARAHILRLSAIPYKINIFVQPAARLCNLNSAQIRLRAFRSRSRTKERPTKKTRRIRRTHTHTRALAICKRSTAVCESQGYRRRGISFPLSHCLRTAERMCVNARIADDTYSRRLFPARDA